jgi:UDP-glucuronate 4-epimerase
MINTALNGGKLKVNGNPRLLNFIYVEDVVSAMIAVAEKTDLKSKVFNIGTEASTNLLDLAKMVRKECGSDSSIEIGPQPDREFVYYCPDTSLAAREFGFTSKTNIADGIHVCVESALESLEGRTNSSVQNLQRPEPA